MVFLMTYDDDVIERKAEDGKHHKSIIFKTKLWNTSTKTFGSVLLKEITKTNWIKNTNLFVESEVRSWKVNDYDISGIVAHYPFPNSFYNLECASQW